MNRSILFAGLSVLLLACGGSSGGTDGGADGAGSCTPVTCELACEHGFARGADGCAVCRCAPAPDGSCTSDADCVLATDVTGCCACPEGTRRAAADAEPCVVERDEVAPAACYPGPERCGDVLCAGCEGFVRAVCEAGTCAGSTECAAGDVPYGFACVPACASHADCTLAANYGQCCGGCSAAPRAFVTADPCWAERQSESMCAPAPGSCDGLGCPSPATDCTGFGGSAVCLADGTCAEGGAGGSCPSGTHDESGVCVP